MRLEKNGDLQVIDLLIKEKEVTLSFSNGKEIDVTINAYLSVGPFSNGQVISKETYDSLIYNDKKERLLNKSYQILSKKLLSCAKLKEQLLKISDDLDLISEVIKRLIEKGYLNDLDYSLNKAQDYFNKLKGFEYIKASLTRDGISENIINIVRDKFSRQFEEKKAIEVAQKQFKIQRGKSHQQKLLSVYNNLLQRGFSVECSENAINSIKLSYNKEEERENAIKDLMKLKKKYSKLPNKRLVYNKIYQGMLSKGYRSNIIMEVLKEVESDD